MGRSAPACEVRCANAGGERRCDGGSGGSRPGGSDGAVEAASWQQPASGKGSATWLSLGSWRTALVFPLSRLAVSVFCEIPPCPHRRCCGCREGVCVVSQTPPVCGRVDPPLFARRPEGADGSVQPPLGPGRRRPRGRARSCCATSRRASKQTLPSSLRAGRPIKCQRRPGSAVSQHSI